jgi:L-serine deaminase
MAEYEKYGPPPPPPKRSVDEILVDIADTNRKIAKTNEQTNKTWGVVMAIVAGAMLFDALRKRR